MVLFTHLIKEKEWIPGCAGMTSLSPRVDPGNLAYLLEVLALNHN